MLYRIYVILLSHIYDDTLAIVYEKLRVEMRCRMIFISLKLLDVQCLNSLVVQGSHHYSMA